MCLFAHVGLHGKARVQGRTAPGERWRQALTPAASHPAPLPGLRALPVPPHPQLPPLRSDIKAVTRLLFNLRELRISRGDASSDGREGTVTPAGLQGCGAGAQLWVRECAAPAELEWGRDDFLPAAREDGHTRECFGSSGLARSTPKS